MFAVEPQGITVPAGGEAVATLTADTRVPGALGVYSGAVVATSGAVRVRTPLAVDKEAERYNLTIRHLDRRGAVPVDYTTNVQGLDRVSGGPNFDPDGTLTLRLPAGRYHLYSAIHTPTAAGPLDVSALAQPLFLLDHDAELMLDAREAKPMRVRVPEQSAQSAAAVVLYERRAPEGLGLLGALVSPNLEHIYTAHLGSSVPDDELVSSVHSQWGKPGAAGLFIDSPYAYHLAWFQRGRYWTGFDRTVKERDLAVVHGEYRTPMPGRTGLVFAGAFPLDGDIGGSSFGFQFRLPFERTEYYLADDTRWQTEFQTIEPDTGAFETSHVKPLFELRRGRHSTEVWGRAVYGPAFPDVEGSPSQWVDRHHGGGSSESSIGTAQDSDAIAVSVPVYNDFSDDHEGFSREDTGRTSLYLDGELIGETDRAGLGDFGVPDADAEYRLEVSGARPSYAEVSTEVSATWTFRFRSRSRGRVHTAARHGGPASVPTSTRTTPRGWTGRSSCPSGPASGGGRAGPGQRSPPRRVLRRRSHLAICAGRTYGQRRCGARAASVERLVRLAPRRGDRQRGELGAADDPARLPAAALRRVTSRGRPAGATGRPRVRTRRRRPRSPRASASGANPPPPRSARSPARGGTSRRSPARRPARRARRRARSWSPSARSRAGRGPRS